MLDKFKNKINDFVEGQANKIENKTQQSFKEAVASGNLIQAMNLATVLRQQGNVEEAINDLILSQTHPTITNLSDLQKAVAELKPANRFQSPWGKKEALKPLSITPEEENGLENFETFEIFAAADSKQIPDKSHENQDAHFEDTEAGIFILADGVSTFHENKDGKVNHPNNISKVSGKLADWTVKELTKKIRDIKLKENDPAKLEYAIGQFVAKDLKTSAENWLNNKSNNPKSEKPVSTTLNIMVRCGDNMIVLNIGDSIVLHKKNTGEIDLITEVHSSGINFLSRYLYNDTTFYPSLTDDEKNKQRNKVIKTAETLLFKYPEKLDGDDFDDSKLEPDETEALDYVINKLIEPDRFDDIKDHLIEQHNASGTAISNLTKYKVALRYIRSYHNPPHYSAAALNRYFPKYASQVSSSIIDISDGDKIISASDGIENIGFKDILEFTNSSSSNLKEIAEELVKQGQITKPHDDCTVQVLEIKAITPPVTPSSPDTLDPVEQAIIVEIHNCEFTLDAGVKAQPDPEQAKEIYLKVKGNSNFINSDNSINLVNLKKSFNTYAEATLLDSATFNIDTFADSWTPDDYL
jgi:serine/threonine protein phosphatase PrpC